MNLLDIEKYNDEMTISQVIRFFERRGIIFTKTMIQNYVKVNVLPPPINKRYYLKNHLILLSLIDSLKSVYSLEEMKIAFSLIDISEVYEDYVLLYNNLVQENSQKISKVFDSVKHSENKNEKNFLPVFMLMAQSALIKQDVIKLLTESTQ